MALMPQMGDTGQYRQGPGAFGGYNHNLYATGRELYEASNLTLRHYPVLSSRSPRGRVRAFGKFNGMTSLNGLVWVDGTGLYVGGLLVGQVSDSFKRMAVMGSRVVIWPDKVMYDTAAGALSGLGARAEGTAIFTLSRLDGEDYPALTSGDAPPAAPANGQYWLDTSGEQDALRVYAADSGVWNQVATAYVKIHMSGLGAAFKQYDGVRISGVENPQFARGGEDYVVQSAGADWIVVAGLIGQGFSAQVVIERRVPELDYIVESGNRLWGCSSENHEIYCCKLGDPSNWYCYQGLSTDSYAATVGSEGDFTGAAEHLGQVLFFKERSVTKVFGSRPANFQIVESRIEGVKAGAAATLAEADGSLFYLSPWGVSAYDGGLPARVSRALGPGRLSGGAAGALDGQYFLSAKEDSGAWRLFLYDVALGQWMREDGGHALAFARAGDELYFVDPNQVLWSVNGSLDSRYADAGAALEEAVEWMAESGDFGLESADEGYLGRVRLRLEVEKGGFAQLWVRYDSEGGWQPLQRVGPTGKHSVSVEAVPRRCDHFRLRISGKGGFRLYGLAVVRQEGSDR